MVTNIPESWKKLIIDFNTPPVLFDLIKNSIVITSRDSEIFYTNPGFTRITGYTADEVQGKNPGMFHSGFHDDLFYNTMWHLIMEEGFWEGEVWNRRKTGEIFPELLTITKIKYSDPNDFFYIAIGSDISFLKKDTEKKMHLAFYDPLTTLPNRNLYFDHLHKIPRFIKHHPKKVAAVFYMDLDKFKQVNDIHGHLAGDKLLHQVGERLAAVSRHGDIIARIGGDEFAAIIMSDGSQKFLEGYAERIKQALEKPFLVDGHSLEISVSIGISLYSADSGNLDVLVDSADRAMYSAKKSGTKIEFSGG